MPYEDDYKMWLEKMLIESNPDWVCDGMYDMGFTHEWCEKYCGEDSEYVTPKCLHMYYHHIAQADRKTEPRGDDIIVRSNLEQFRVGLEYHTDTTHFGKVKGESITTNKVEDEPQTERSE